MRGPILITGCPRSGTSMVAGILSTCGVFMGNTAGPTINNQKGFYENLSVRNDVIKPYLSSIGADPRCQSPLPDRNTVLRDSKDPKTIGKLRQDVIDIMTEEGYKDGHWAIKDPKILPIWEIFDAAFPGALWVVTRRLEEDTAASCARTSFMNAFSDEVSWIRWIRRLTSLIDGIVGKVDSVFEVYPQRVINQYIESNGLKIPEECLRLLEFVGIRETDSILDFITPSLWPATKEGICIVKSNS